MVAHCGWHQRLQLRDDRAVQPMETEPLHNIFDQRPPGPSGQMLLHASGLEIIVGNRERRVMLLLNGASRSLSR